MRIGIKQRAVHALLALSLLMLVACANMQPRRVIVAWHTLSGARERAFLRLVDRWNQTNGDDIVVVPERREPAAQHRALLEGAATGLLPDLALVQPAEAALYAQRGLLAQLDRFTGSDDAMLNWDAADRADLFPFVQQAGRTPRGQLLGAPFGGDMQIVLTNRDWMNSLGQAEIPADWEAFGKACDGATDRIAGTACFGFDPNDASAEDWLYAHGAPIYDPPTQQLQIASPEVVSAIEALLNYLQSGRAYRAISSERSRDDFAAARVLFALTSTDRLHNFTQTVRERGNFGLDVGTFPTATNAPTASIRAPLWVVLKRTDDRERAAWKFIHWLLETEQTAQWAAETEQMPARISALAAMELNPEQPLDALRIKALQRIAPVARPAPLVSGWPCVQAELSNALRQIIEGQPLDSTLVLAQTRAQTLLNSDCALQ
ncbi:MAG: extracellular solute-binding protein [Anaerolineae bacterium]|nr:extracellular solute-binding protein [Candidatus Roseilinea sp.]MDW8451078.1 extracellular solute-binding protein [Anaerolineae bacterium]